MARVAPGASGKVLLRVLPELPGKSAGASLAAGEEFAFLVSATD
jgi:hypothetical protein